MPARVALVPALGAEAARDAVDNEPAADQIRRLATGWWQRLRTERQQVLTRLVHSELAHFPDLMQFYADDVVARGRRLMVSIIERGIARGEFRAIDPQVAARMYSAIWMSHGTWCARPQFHPSLGNDEQVLEEMLEFYFHALTP